MSETPTPRTDAAGQDGMYNTMVNHALRLELELNAAKALAEQNRKLYESENKDLLAVIKTLARVIAEREQNGKLAHDNGIAAMKYRKQRIILQAALEEIATGAYCMKTAYDHIAPNAIKQANQLDEQ